MKKLILASLLIAGTAAQAGVTKFAAKSAFKTTKFAAKTTVKAAKLAWKVAF